MAIMDQKRSALKVPYAMEVADRVRKERYYDPDFYHMEAELLWPRVWQMACRLEEIPQPATSSSTRSSTSRSSWFAPATWGCGRFRTPAGTGASGSSRAGGPVRPASSARSTVGATEPTAPTPSSPGRGPSPSTTCTGDLDLTPVQCETWGGCAWINLDDEAPPLRQCIEPFATILDAWKVESLRTEWWYACRLPVNWKLAQEAFVESTTWSRRILSCVIPGRYRARDGRDVRSPCLHRRRLQYLRTMSEGMAGMVHANDVRIAEGLRDMDLPADPMAAVSAWNRALNDAVGELAPGARAVTSPTSTSSTSTGSTSRWATASPTTWCCPCTAAPPPTGSARWGPRRR